VALIPKQIELDGQTVDAYEDTDLRRANAKHFRLPDGRRVVVLQEGQHYLDRDTGQWEETDNAVVADERPDGFSHAVNRVPLRIRFGPRGRQRIGFGVGKYITLSAVDVRTVVQPVVEGNRVTYADLWTDADLVYEHGVERLKESIVLRSPQAPASFSFRVVEQVNLTLHPAPDGSIEVKNADGALGRILAPWCQDANGARGPAVLAWDGTYLTITPDASWLSDSERAWPVVVDPTITLQPGPTDGKDSWVNATSGYEDTNYGGDIYIRVGVINTWATHGRGLIEFSLEPLGEGLGITSAKLWLYVYPTVGADYPSYVYAHRVLAPWEEYVVTRNNQPSHESSAASSAYVHNNTAAWYSWELTSLVRSWYEGSVANYGIKLINSTDSNYYAKFFYSSDYSNSSLRPKLEVIYTKPSVAISSPNGTQSNPTIIYDTLQLQLQGVYNSEDNVNMAKRRHWVYDELGNVVWDSGEVEDSATPGSTVAVTVPAGLLSYGVLYRWTWRAWDENGGYSDIPSGGWFKLILSAPTGLTATADAANAEIDLSWNAHNGEALAGYNVYQSADGGTTWEKINTVLVTATNYSDRYVKSGTAMQYKITAVASDGFESDYSSTASATVTISGVWIQGQQVRLREPARRGFVQTRLASARQALDGTWVVQDRGWGKGEMTLLILYQSLDERDQLLALFSAGAVIYYRDQSGDRFRGKVSQSVRLDEMWAGAGWLPVVLTEVTPA